MHENFSKEYLFQYFSYHARLTKQVEFFFWQLAQRIFLSEKVIKWIIAYHKELDTHVNTEI